MATDAKGLKIPRFKNESAEAKWWFDNQDKLLAVFENAAAEGRLGRGTALRKLAEKRATRATTIRLDTEDISLARAQAEKRGLKYQTYLKMIIHEALHGKTRKA